MVTSPGCVPAATAALAALCVTVAQSWAGAACRMTAQTVMGHLLDYESLLRLQAPC